MDFGHLFQREWILKPRTSLAGLQRYRPPDGLQRLIEPTDVVAAFVHHGCILLTCYRGRWETTVNPKVVKDWFCRHVLAFCIVLWWTLTGRVWQSDVNPYHLYFQSDDADHSTTIERKELSDDHVDLGYIRTLIMGAHMRDLTVFALPLAYAILWRVDSILSQRAATGNAEVHFTYPRRHPGYDPTVPAQADLARPLRYALMRIWSQTPAILRDLQFTTGGWWTGGDGGKRLLLTHYCGFGLLRFWGLGHQAVLTDAARRHLERRDGPKGVVPVALFVRDSFRGRVRAFDSIRQVVHMLMMANGTPSEQLTQMLLKPRPATGNTPPDQKGCNAAELVNRQPGPTSVSDARRVLLSGLLGDVSLEQIATSPHIRYGLYAYARYAAEHQVNTCGHLRWSSIPVPGKMLETIDSILEQVTQRRVDPSRIDDLCIRVLTTLQTP